MINNRWITRLRSFGTNNFFKRWKILFWKNIFMRRQNIIVTILEIVIPIIFCLQIRLIFQPLALHIKNLDVYTKKDIINQLPHDVEYWYAPRNDFTDDLMSRVSRVLDIKIQPADSEKSLILLHYSKNITTKALWAIFEIDKNGRPNTLNYKIRSSEIGNIMHDEEPFYKDPYIRSGFMAFQMAIENSFIDMWKNSRISTIGENLTITRYPFYKIDFLVMRSVVYPNINIIYYITVIAFVILPMASLQKMIYDKETGFRGLMRLTNMSFTIMYLGWLNYLMMTSIPVAIACTILLYPIFMNAYVITIFLFIIMYIIVSTLVFFAIGTFFRYSIKAILMAFSIWLFLSHFTLILDQCMVKASLTWRIVSLILPHSGLLYGIVAFASGTEIDKYLLNSLKEFAIIDETQPYIDLSAPISTKRISGTTNNEYEIIYVKEKISVNAVLISWIFHIIFWLFFAIYLDNINPGQYWSAKPWYFLCKKVPSKSIYYKFKLRGSTNWSAVERMPSFIKPSILVRCATKKFGTFISYSTILNEITIDFYQNEFSVILGINGSGKSTLLKLITGIYSLTDGGIFVKGRDFKADINIKNFFGYCPQENILVNYMTTIEHLYMFGMMKGMTYKDAYANASELLKKLSLESVKNKKLKNLSNGIQRRICLGMALIGESQILILDEPTYGVDSEERKLILNLLSDIKRTKTILLATNSMEATDILADKIAIITNGTIECYGSKMYLNRRYGIGYILSLVVNENYDLHLLQMEIQEFSSEAITLRSIMGLVIRFNIPRNSRFTRLLQYLENNKQRLNIISLALTTASIEGQFLRINLASQFKERGVEHPSKEYEIIVQQRRRNILRNAKSWNRLSGTILWYQQIFAMFYKKFLHVISSWKLYLFSISLAIITLILATMIDELINNTVFDTMIKTMNLKDYADNSFNILYYAADSTLANKFLGILYKTTVSYKEKGTYHVLKTIPASKVMTNPNLHSIEFRDRCLMSIDIQPDGSIDLIYSSSFIHSGPVALNLLNNAILRYYCGSNECNIDLKSHPLIHPTKWQHQFVHSRSIRNWQNAAVIGTLFLLFPTINLGIKELNSLSKMLQINTIGVSTLMYWIPIYIIDLLIYTIAILILTAFFLVIYRKKIFLIIDIVRVLYIFLLYGACAIPLNYCVQLLTKKQQNVYLIVILINIFVILLLNGSLICPIIFHALDQYGRYLFELFVHIIPPYNLTCALSNYLILSLYNKKCHSKNTCDTEVGIEDPCCQNCGEKICFKPLNIMLTRQSGQEFFHSVFDDIINMLSMTIALHLILQIFERNNRLKWYRTPVSYESNDNTSDITVINEKKQVEEHMKFYEENQCLPEHVMLTAKNLTKRYGKIKVQNINFNVYQRDCFGILGFNNSGKTTIFEILVGQTRISAGKAVIYEYEFPKNLEMFIGMIGYCPQISGLNDFMTGRQHLILYAALRGIPFENLMDEVNKWLDLLDLLEFENVKIGNCSWGIQRKIAVLQSLIGDLPLILLNEPTSGIDVTARQAICDILYQIREMGRSLLIITHNMQEAEAMCTRVGILVEGRFVVIDSCENLKRKHDNNFILNIGVIPAFQNQHLITINNIVNEAFPGIKLKDFHMGIIKYELESNISHSNVFEILEQLRRRHTWLTDFTVNQPSMDQVFLDLTIKNDSIIQNQVLRRTKFWNFLKRFK
ncbi:phospholipid-transporting ATPase ABCA1-like [Vespula squamosa]|uniref:Phospholipid-transporting ATPase ABCA1-like n=1 Tax=Vespula squamosa TaxID=30214 RepID=A0ABD2A1D7_VESSQ